MNTNNKTAAFLTWPDSHEKYQDHISDAIDSLKDDHRKRKPIKLREVLEELVDPEQDNTDLVEWLIDKKITTKREFNNLITTIKRDFELTTEFGFKPIKNDAENFIKRYCDHNRIFCNLNGTISWKKPVFLGNIEVSEADAELDETSKIALQVANTKPKTLENLFTELFVSDRKFDLGYGDKFISMALRKWNDQMMIEQRIRAYLNIKYDATVADAPEVEDMWQLLNSGPVYDEHIGRDFNMQVMKKLIWQVKRKMLGLKVTNHLMIVITGMQSGGKSTLVEKLLSPINGSWRRATFNDVMNDKLISIWDSAVLFLDEMSYATSADMNTIKNLITTPFVQRRYMGSNELTEIPQMATWIGCSNNSLAQVIKDSTGMRRFIELKAKPQGQNCWDELEKIDWLKIWQSVDENGDDPTASIRDLLEAQQEEARSENADPIELWMNSLVDGELDDFTNTETIYKDFYKVWEGQYFRSYDRTFGSFKPAFKNLIETRFADTWERRQVTKSGVQYRRKNVGAVVSSSRTELLNVVRKLNAV